MSDSGPHQSHGDLAVAAEALREGRCVVVPTDTVYGLAASLARPAAIDDLFSLKGRPPDMPIAVLVADRIQAESVVHMTPLAERLAERWWPGPLTLVLEGRDDLAAAVGSTAGTIGVRLPDHPLVRDLAALVGPLATTSANRHGAPPPAEAADVAALFTEVEVVLDGGRLEGVASTVADARGEAPLVLRQGPVAL